MRTFLLFFMTTLVLTANPVIYATLGDKIYDQMPVVKSLTSVEGFSADAETIEQYLKMCGELKTAGLAIDAKEVDAMGERDYLKALRKLDRQREGCIRKANALVSDTISQDDYTGFKTLIDSGMINIEAQEEAILDYYVTKRDEITIDELEMYLEYKKKQQEYAKKRKSERQESYQAYRENRIERFRKKDKAEQEAFEEELNAEVEATKEEVDHMLKEELRIKR